jgi:hypothetical protein
MATEGDESERVALARLALTAALAQPGVVGAQAGAGLPRVTSTRSGGLLSGVAVSAAAGGRYEVDLRLVAELVPLDQLADRVRARLATAAKRKGLAALLGAVNIEFVDLAAATDSTTDTNARSDPPARAPAASRAARPDAAGDSAANGPAAEEAS